MEQSDDLVMLEQTWFLWSWLRKVTNQRSSRVATLALCIYIPLERK